MLANILKIALLILPFVIQWIQRRWAARDKQKEPSSEKMGEALAARDTRRIRDLLDELP